MLKLKLFILGSIEEMTHKVSWSKYNELQSSAILIMVGSLVFGILIGLIDLTFKHAISWFYNFF